MGRLLFISALLHVALLVVLPMVPRLSRDYDAALDTYMVELVDITPATKAAEPAAAEEPTKVEEPVVEKTPVEEKVEEAKIPERPEPKPKRVVLKPPAVKSESTLEERLEERLKAQDQRRPEPAKPAEERRGDAAPAQTSTARVSASRFPYSWYLSVVQGKVSSNWVQPSARLILEDSLTTSVSFSIGRDGSISDVRVSRSSGRSTVDQSAAKAVRDSAPFPPLPDDYRETRLEVTIDFTILKE